MVPMLTCGFVRSNLAFATVDPCPFGPFAGLLGPAGLTACLKFWWWYYSPGLLAGRLRDELLGDVLRNLGIAVELHRVARPALRLRPEVADVAEHLRQRHQSLDAAGTAPLLHGLDLAAAGVEVADDIPH